MNSGCSHERVADTAATGDAYADATAATAAFAA
eukprot:CAMPEP_0172724260 /NCGR_PEP_ID=MMETSP1074-20121228/85554_1 /TAXON_ID=2916 /ORGANISM="Ceratium fusus, Strain PA161109" /LENGTH=32 /DNA_ID= /DNA_START= /DNA_END= /DNA_ORIENTATION=